MGNGYSTPYHTIRMNNNYINSGAYLQKENNGLCRTAEGNNIYEIIGMKNSYSTTLSLLSTREWTIMTETVKQTYGNVGSVRSCGGK